MMDMATTRLLSVRFRYRRGGARQMSSQLTASPARSSGVGTTAELIAFVENLSWDRLDPEVQHYAKRHLLDTIGVMIAGSTGQLAVQCESVLCAVRPSGTVPVPGRFRRADVLDACFLAGAAGHGIELDDGYRQGSVHPGVCVVPAALYGSYSRAIAGRRLLESVVLGYEVMTALACATHPALRRRGFHPTSVLGVFGAAAAAARLHGLDTQQIANALGIAASSSAGLFAFINGGADTNDCTRACCAGGPAGGPAGRGRRDGSARCD